MATVPALDYWQHTESVSAQTSVAELAGRVQSLHPNVEPIERTANAAVIIYYTDQQGSPAADYVSPVTGVTLAPYQPSAWDSWVKDLHRAFVAGAVGHYNGWAQQAYEWLYCLHTGQGLWWVGLLLGLRQLIESGAQILVCGGREMAAGVSSVLEDILAPMQMSVSDLKTQGRFLEDVFRCRP